MSGRIQPGVPVTPSCVAINYGSDPQYDVPAHFVVESAGVVIYDDSTLIWSLPAFDTATVAWLTDWTPGGGLWQGYRVTVNTALEGDQAPRNDTARVGVIISPDTLFSYWKSGSWPYIDGYIETGEWDQAYSFDASNVTGWRTGPQEPGSARGYFMHDSLWLYVAFELPPALTRDTHDLVGLYFDENNNGQWEANLTEGNHDVWLNDSVYDEVLYRPWTASGPGQAQYCPGATSASGIFNGHLVFEARIPFGTVPYKLALNPQGDTCGLWLHAVHHGTCLGWWRLGLPQDSFGIPAGYGKLILRPRPQGGDIAVERITSPVGRVAPRSLVTPRFMSCNYGTTPMSFMAYAFLADPSGQRVYRESLWVSGLGGGQTRTLDFPPFNVDTVEGLWAVVCSVRAQGDLNPANDWRRGAFTVGPTADFAVTRILAPAGNLDPLDTVQPSAVIRCNFAQRPLPARTWFFLSKPGGARCYADSVDLADMATAQETTLSFRAIVLDSTAGTWTARCSLYAPADTFAANNIGSGTFRVGMPVPSYGWREVSPSVPGIVARAGAWLAGSAADPGVYCAKGNKSAEFYRYDPIAGAWSTMSPIPPGREGKPPYTGSVGVSDSRGHVYAVKGANTLGFHKYFAGRNGWLQLADVPAGGGRKVKAGSDLAYATCGDSVGVYLLKGYRNEFYRYEPTGESTGAWQALASPPGEKWPAGSWLCFDGVDRIYAQQARTHAFHCYNLFTGTWQTVPNTMPFVSRFTGRSKKSKDGGSAAWWNGSIYALKGGSTQDFFKFTPATGVWTELDTMPAFGSTMKRIKVKAGGDIVNYLSWFYALKGAKTNEFWSYREPGTLGSPVAPAGGVMAKAGAAPGRLTVQPNPATRGQARVRCRADGPAVLELFDASGRLVWSRPTQGPGAREFLLPRLSSGVYLLRLDGPDGATECKLVMQ